MPKFTTACKPLLCGVLGAIIGLLVVGCTNDQQPGTDSGPVRSSAEQFDANVECMRERGWEIVVLDDETWNAPGISEAQYPTYVADTNACREQNEVLKPPESVSDDRWNEAYAKTVKTAQCLRDQGFEIPETPSFQAWKDSFFADDGANQWNPWRFVPVPSMNDDEFTQLEAMCPQVGL